MKGEAAEMVSRAREVIGHGVNNAMTLAQGNRRDGAIGGSLLQVGNEDASMDNTIRCILFIMRGD